MNSLRWAIVAALVASLSGCAASRQRTVVRGVVEAQDGFSGMVDILYGCPVVMVYWRNGGAHQERWTGTEWVAKEYLPGEKIPTTCE